MIIARCERCDSKYQELNYYSHDNVLLCPKCVKEEAENKTKKECDCGAIKTKSTHFPWCSTLKE